MSSIFTFVQLRFHKKVWTFFFDNFEMYVKQDCVAILLAILVHSKKLPYPEQKCLNL